MNIFINISSFSATRRLSDKQMTDRKQLNIISALIRIHQYYQCRMFTSQQLSPGFVESVVRAAASFTVLLVKT